MLDAFCTIYAYHGAYAYGKPSSMAIEIKRLLSTL